tara:strand:+ start:443 stop:1267 length:825 start_codon:yes stop_codon:yes gene_type:complete
MATAEDKTFTVDTSVPTETVTDNLTPEEQDSLAVGEKLEAEQETLLAGKYKSTEDLEKAYKELESKLGQPTADEAEDAEIAEAEAEDKPDAKSLSENANIITQASEEYYQNGNKLSPETLQKFRGMSSEDLVNAYLEVTNTGEWSATPTDIQSDVTEQQINEVKNSAGGDQQYADMVQWAGKNLDEKSIKAFDHIISTGSVDAIKFAVSGLRTQYLNAVGYDGTMLQGKAPQNNRDVFRSQAELVAAMSDKRYDNDPAYRQDIIEKLDRSDLEF